MPKQGNTIMILRLLGIGIALIQLFDIIIHAATNQIEPLRVSSNIIILLWLAVVASGRINAKFMQVAVGSIGSYLVLNLIFLILEGVTNPNQGGELRGDRGTGNGERGTVNCTKKYTYKTKRYFFYDKKRVKCQKKPS